MSRYLVVANETADSSELLDAVTKIHADDPMAEFDILVPATPLNLLQQFEGAATSARSLAAQRAQSTRTRLENSGLRIASTRVGNWDPSVAIEHELSRGEYTALVLSTLPPGMSRWLRMDLPSRVARRHPDVRLIHVVARSVAT